MQEEDYFYRNKPTMLLLKSAKKTNKWAYLMNNFVVAFAIVINAMS